MGVDVDSSALIELGAVGAPFGVRGWVKLRSYTDPPGRLLEHKHVRLVLNSAAQMVRVEASGRSGGALTAKFAGIDDRDRARALRGAGIWVPRAELPRAQRGDYLRADLIGCEVVNLAGSLLGVVQYFVETPAHAVMVVRGSREFWVPAIPRHLRNVDLGSRRVVVDWDEAASASSLSGLSDSNTR